MNDDQYNQYTEIKGKLYRYDPDFDCYYRAYTEEERVQYTRETLWIFGVTLFIMIIGIIYETFVA